MQTKLVLGNSCIERDGADMVFRANTINVGIKPATFTHCNHFKTQFYTENKKKEKKISCTVYHNCEIISRKNILKLESYD